MENVGVIIGRLQVENLHPGHKFLIDTAAQNHPRVLILLGNSPIRGTRYNPLDYETRCRMIREAYPDVTILPIVDKNTDVAWSNQVDAVIKTIFPMAKATIYGGRGSFIPHYKPYGQFDVIELDSGIEYQSGTQQRKHIGKAPRSSADFRAGQIYALENYFPYKKICVDIAVLKGKQILLGRKPCNDQWQLPGGMVDPQDMSLEAAARREFREEAGGVDISDPEYVRSFHVDDWRFKKVEETQLLTSLFVCKYVSGHFEAGDDLEEVQLFDFNDDRKEFWKLRVIPEHQSFYEPLVKYISQQGKEYLNEL